jgi:ribosomal protein S27E
MANPIHLAAGQPTRRRSCPHCHHRQLVPVVVGSQAVRCRRCGAPIPPPGAKSGSAGSTAVEKKRG